MKRILFIVGLISIISLSPFFAQDAESQPKNEQNDEKAGSDSADAFAIIPELEAEEVSDLSFGRTKAVFKTSVKSSAIYLNGNLQGRTPLTVSSLVEGYYLLRAEKEGYKPVENFVYIENSKAKTFYVELEMDEETQKRMDARAERAAQREAEKAQTANESTQSAEVQAESGIGDAK